LQTWLAIDCYSSNAKKKPRLGDGAIQRGASFFEMASFYKDPFHSDTATFHARLNGERAVMQLWPNTTTFISIFRRAIMHNEKQLFVH